MTKHPVTNRFIPLKAWAVVAGTKIATRFPGFSIWETEAGARADCADGQRVVRVEVRLIEAKERA